MKQATGIWIWKVLQHEQDLLYHFARLIMNSSLAGLHWPTCWYTLKGRHVTITVYLWHAHSIHSKEVQHGGNNNPDPACQCKCNFANQSDCCLAAEAVGGDPKLRSTNQEVAQLLEQVAALGEDTGEADLTQPSGPAPNRFAAAVLASVEAAGNVKAAETR